MRALGVYIFAGGFTVGMREWFDIVGHFEDGPFGVETAKRNLGVQVWSNPLHWPVDQVQGVDVIYGNPPCAPWSSAGHWTTAKRTAVGVDNIEKRKHHLDPRTACVLKQFELLGRCRPKVWVWESVVRAYTIGRPFVDELTEQAVAMGYAVDHVLINGKNHGLPQDRKRFFFVATQVKIDWGKPLQIAQPTVRSTIGHLEHDPGPVQRISESMRRLLEQTPPGTKLHKVWEEHNPPETHQVNAKGGVIGRPGYLHDRLDWGIAPTVFGTHLYHPSQPRRLSVLETQLLCGYPADYTFDRRDAFNEIARAVLPPVGRWMGANLQVALRHNVPATAGEVRCVDLR